MPVEQLDQLGPRTYTGPLRGLEDVAFDGADRRDQLLGDLSIGETGRCGGAADARKARVSAPVSAASRCARAIAVPDNPTYVAVSPDGSVLYVTNTQHNTVTVITRADEDPPSVV